MNMNTASSGQSQDQVVMMQVFAGAFMQAINTISTQNKQLPGSNCQLSRFEVVEDSSDALSRPDMMNPSTRDNSRQEMRNDPSTQLPDQRRNQDGLIELPWMSHDDSIEEVRNTQSGLQPIQPITEVVDRVETMIQTRPQQSSNLGVEDSCLQPESSGRSPLLSQSQLPPELEPNGSLPNPIRNTSFDSDSELSSIPDDFDSRCEAIIAPCQNAPQRTRETIPEVSAVPLNPQNRAIPSTQNKQSVISDGVANIRSNSGTRSSGPIQQFSGNDGLPRLTFRGPPSARKTEKAPVIVISDSEDEPNGRDSQNRPVNRRHYRPNSHTMRNVGRHVLQRRDVTDEDADWDLEEDIPESYSRKRSLPLNHDRGVVGMRDERYRSRQQRHEREWQQKRRAMVQDLDREDERMRQEHQKMNTGTPPLDYDLGHSEMQEFEGLLRTKRQSITQASSTSMMAGIDKTQRDRADCSTSSLSNHQKESLSIPSFMLVMDREQRAANKGRYDLEDAIAAFDRELSSGATPRTTPPPEESAIEVVDNEDASKDQADVKRRIQQYVDENEEFFAATDEDLTEAAVKGKLRIAECEANERAEKARIWSEVLEVVSDNPEPVQERSYLKHEWPEPDNIRTYLKHRLASIPVEIAQKCTLESLTICVNNLTARPPIPERTISHSVIIKDVEDQLLLVKVNTGIEEVFADTPKYKEKGKMYKHIMDSMNRMESHGVHPPKPRSSDARHSSDRYTVAKEYWATKNQPCGVFYFACWRPLGAYRGHFSSIAGPYGHVLSRDILGEGAWDFGIRARYLANMAPVHQAISLWFEAIDKPRYEECRTLVDKLAEADTGLDVVKYAQTQSFLALATLRNMQARNHKDRTNVTDGWAGMTCVGSFTGGELCLPDLDLNITFLPGDVIFFRSSLLEHFVRRFVGTRSSLIFFSQTDPKIPLTQNARFIEPGSKEWERIAAHRKAEIAEEERKKEKMKEFVGLEPYPTKESDLSPYKLQTARRRKLRFVGFARREAEKGESGKVGWDEVKRLEGLDDARFYELNLVELNRWKRGCYPFKPMGDEERRREKRRRERERERIRRGG